MPLKAAEYDREAEVLPVLHQIAQLYRHQPIHRAAYFISGMVRFVRVIKAFNGVTGSL